VPFPNYDEATVSLAQGTTVLLYTDGLVERPDMPLEDGLEWLHETASGWVGQPDDLCRVLLEARFGEIPPRDDVAVLAVRLEPVPAGPIEITLRAEPESLAHMRRTLGRWLRNAGAGETDTYELLVACGEACANAIAHAYPPGEASFVVEASRADGRVDIRVRDFGSWRPPRAGSRGRGLRLIEELVDEVEISRGPPGTVVAMSRAVGTRGDR
jgi:anti-sigma regulatory factor (Ser/Thr protein kinase)